MFARVALKLSPEEMLRILSRLRFWALLVTLASLFLLPLLLSGQGLPHGLGVFAIMLAVWSGLVWWRSRRAWPVTEWEITLHLLADTALLVWLLWVTGGSASPFVALFLVPVGLAAAALPPWSAWSLVALAAGAYSLLIWWQPPHAQHGGQAFFMHVMGMWLTFIVSALLLVVFVSAMASAVRRRDASLARAREQMLRAEQLSRVGCLAAGAAHELGTPLATAKTALADIRQKAAGDDELEADLSLIDEQLEICRDRLHALLRADGAAQADPGPLPVEQWLQAGLARWRGMRPANTVRAEIPSAAADCRIRVDESLTHSLLSLLDNAADASAQSGDSALRLVVERQAAWIFIHIDDTGPGLSRADRQRAGRVRFSGKTQGHGLGLVLSHATLERLGGQLRLTQREAGGTRTTLCLPLVEAVGSPA